MNIKSLIVSIKTLLCLILFIGTISHLVHATPCPTKIPQDCINICDRKKISVECQAIPYCEWISQKCIGTKECFNCAEFEQCGFIDCPQDTICEDGQCKKC